MYNLLIDVSIGVANGGDQVSIYIAKGFHKWHHLRSELHQQQLLRFHYVLGDAQTEVASLVQGGGVQSQLVQGVHFGQKHEVLLQLGALVGVGVNVGEEVLEGHVHDVGVGHLNHFQGVDGVDVLVFRVLGGEQLGHGALHFEGSTDGEGGF